MKLVMHHAGTTKTFNNFPDELWPAGDYVQQARVAIGRWCDLSPGRTWTGSIYGPVEWDGSELTAHLARNADRFDFIITPSNIEGPW